MSLVSVQCPNCGSPVEAPPAGSMMRCPACASILEIKTGSSGYPLATLAAIGQDTSFLAKRQAVALLREQLETLRSQRAQREAAIRTVEASQTGCGPILAHFCILVGAIGAIGIAGGLLFAGEFMGGWLIVLFLAVTTYAILCLTNEDEKERAAEAKSRLERLRSEYQPLLKEISDKEARLQRLEADLDRLTHAL